MSNSRITYQNWIVDLGRDPSLPVLPPITPEESNEIGVLQARVQQSLQCLSEDERELIRQFYYMGYSYRHISQKSGRAIYKLEAMHRRALRKLRNDLGEFIQSRFHIDLPAVAESVIECHICASPHRDEIDLLIAGRDQRATWRPVMNQLRREFDVDIRSPQMLIGHERYHMRRKD
ncbi:MAG: hypothetical protein KOO62_11675 [candidate division Zixibacteria bacterium]|nr:hypothetical protein [candidate division Zixibacteria bacterium]